MAELGIRILDQTGGNKVATRTARTVESETFLAREIQQVDVTGCDLSLTTIRTGITAVDSNTITGSTAWFTNKLACGDRASVVVAVTVTAGVGTFNNVTITPVMYDVSNNVIGVLESKTTGKGNLSFIGTSSEAYLPMLSWDLLGAYYIGLHVSAFDGTGTLTIKAGVV